MLHAFIAATLIRLNKLDAIRAQVLNKFISYPEID